MYYKKNAEFPKDFLWGAASSAFQIEGAYLEDGKGLSSADVRSFKKSYSQADSKVASDHYHHYKEDIALMKELGLKSYRFSIAWSRIFPYGKGEVNKKGIAFYDSLINELRKANIEPIVTMYHFDIPQALIDEYGGWMDRKCITDYCTYAKVLFDNFGDRVTYWIYNNEQNAFIYINDLAGIQESDSHKADQIRHQMNYHMLLAMAKVTKLCHSMLPHAKIGPAVAYLQMYPKTCKPEDVLAAKDNEDIITHYLLDVHCYGKYPKYYIQYLEDRDCMFHTEKGDDEILQCDRPDFIGINYYFTYASEYCAIHEKLHIADQQKYLGQFLGNPEFGSYKRCTNEYLKTTEYGWQIDPIGLRIAMRKLHERYHLPIMITENGIGMREQLEDGIVQDDYRISYLSQHLEQLGLAIQDGVNVIGYQAWTFMDVLSSSDGFAKRYGFVYVNRDDFDLKDMARIPKKSYTWYQEVIKRNGLK